LTHDAGTFQRERNSLLHSQTGQEIEFELHLGFLVVGSQFENSDHVASPRPGNLQRPAGLIIPNGRSPGKVFIPILTCL